MLIQGNTSREPGNVILVERNVLSVPRNHSRRAHNLQVVDVKVIRRSAVARRIAHIDNTLLAPGSGADLAARRAIVVEEGVVSRAERDDVLAADDTETPGHLAWRAVGVGVLTFSLEVWVVVALDAGEWDRGWRVGLVLVVKISFVRRSWFS